MRLRLTGQRCRRPKCDLKELEFLALAVVHERGTMIVGDIARLLKLRPAAMSRIIRSLEWTRRDKPLISCLINPRDRRMVDVVLTPAGEQALQDYLASTDRLIQLLSEIPEHELVGFNQVISSIASR